MFDTYGPFVMHEDTSAGLQSLFEQMREDETVKEQSLEWGIGVYIIAAEGNGGLVPWYVGRTYNQFRNRLEQHYKAGKFTELLKIGPVSVFLIARAKDGVLQMTTPAMREEREAEEITELELVLIGHCLRLNPKLLNKQEVSRNQRLHVPGFIDNGGSERNFPAAQALSELLRTQESRG